MPIEPNKNLPTFRDAAGREWELRLDFARVRRIRDKLRVDLGDIPQIGRTWAELLASDLKALDAIWLAIVECPLTQDEWLAAMDGERLDEAREALRQALENFTPPLKRDLLIQGLNAVDEAYRRAIEQAESDVRDQTKAALARALQPGTQRSASPELSAGGTIAGH
jgi:hypothetical protein